jgi:putative DNA primase/helicase
MMAGAIAKGSAVRLAEHDDVLGIAEGIETALSASALFRVPCWAALNAEMLRAWSVPSGVKSVVIFGDNDENFTGQAAAYALARKLTTDGVKAEIKIPDRVGADWNDEYGYASREPSAA